MQNNAKRAWLLIAMGLLAVPLAAATGVLARFALQQYMASPLYHGGAPPLPGPSADL